jgi:acetolactate synthase small subunit
MTEVYNMTQAQRDAAHIAALEKQVQDLSAVVKALACNRHNVSAHLSLAEVAQSHDSKELVRMYAEHAAHQLADVVLKDLSDRVALYEQLAQYQQWFYARTNYTTRYDALRSTMTTAR